jgi:hypothetical protein
MPTSWPATLPLPTRAGLRHSSGRGETIYQLSNTQGHRESSAEITSAPLCVENPFQRQVAKKAKKA